MIAKTQPEQERRPGIGIDASGAAVIDPTKNVEDLVRAGEVTHTALRAADNRFIDAQLTASEKLQNFAREAETRLQNFAREAESKLQTALRDSETRRIDQLAENRQEFQNTIRDMLAESVRTTSTLVSTQLVQIQATFDTRVSKLEAFQWQSAGRSSVADPQIADAMLRMTSSLSTLKSNTDEMMAKMTAANIEAIAKLTTTIAGMQNTENRSGGQVMGRESTNARLLAVVMAVAAVVSPILSVIVAITVMRGH